MAFDRKAPTFRHLAYEGYKAKRHAMPEELAMQMPVLKEVLGRHEHPRLRAGRLGGGRPAGHHRPCRASRQGWDCVIVTGDRDSLQLVTDHTTVNLVTSSRGQTTVKQVTPAAFRGRVWLRAYQDDRPEGSVGGHLRPDPRREGHRREDRQKPHPAVRHHCGDLRKAGRPGLETGRAQKAHRGSGTGRTVL